MRYSPFRSTQTEENKPRYGDFWRFSDEEKKEELMGMQSDAAIITTHWDMRTLGHWEILECSVRGKVEVSNHGKIKPCVEPN